MRRDPGVLDPRAFVRRLLRSVKVVALPDVPCQIPQHPDVVMVAAAAGRGGLAKLAAANDATKSLMLVVRRQRGAAPKRGAVMIGQRT